MECGQVQNLNLIGSSGSVVGQIGADDSGIPTDGESLGSKDPDAPLDSRDPGGGPRSREEHIIGDSGKGQVQTSKSEDGNSEGALGQQAASGSENTVEGKLSPENDLSSMPEDLKGGPSLNGHTHKWSSLFRVKPKCKSSLPLVKNTSNVLG